MLDSEGVESPSSEPSALLVDADSHGAIVLAGEELLGYRRSGGRTDVAWRKPLGDLESYAQLVCGATAPSLIASGGLPGGPAPSPYAIGETGAPGAWLYETGGLNSIFAADAEGAVRLVSHAGSADTWWELSSRHSPAHRIPDAGSGGVLFPRSTDRRVLTVRTRTRDDDATTFVFRRRTTGWQLALRAPGRVAAGVSADGETLVSGATLVHQGHTFSIRTRIEYSACSLTRTGVVLTRNLSTPTGPATDLAVLDHTGHEVAALALADEATVTTSWLSDAFAVSLTAGREVRLFDGAGHELARLPDHGASQFDERGHLCALDRQGVPTWHDPAQLSV
ncbi:hypothetical protein [Nocardioides sp. cx-173]|uniref:hypothetical protein n=1 Tax=Nocardioides sp. cx-173 TaxID=2898796 RepID=UPI001E4914DB|nr:hypothetical protein [Nocardioides sp. cx-173]MCD4525258.1 hypothetical protein [Nocardioides sp. cx-173]UGB40940.1 hypothetical protein LQ940_16375 [Nocardioides sp. cx-173]